VFNVQLKNSVVKVRSPIHPCKYLGYSAWFCDEWQAGMGQMAQNVMSSSKFFVLRSVFFIFLCTFDLQYG
jgi:hypothetical protein